MKGSGKKPKYELSDELINYMADKQAFIYPHLLPTMPLKPNFTKGSSAKFIEEDAEKPYFAHAEDNIIALGLEHFFGGTDKWKNKFSSKGLGDACSYISSTLMRGKTTKHIRVRIKNRKDKHKLKQKGNPITFYFENNYAPREAMKELTPYDPRAVVAPRFADPITLPTLWREKLKRPLETVSAPSTISSNLPITVTVQEVVTPLFTVRLISSCY